MKGPARLGERNMLMRAKAMGERDPLNISWADQWEFNQLIAKIALEVQLNNHVIRNQVTREKEIDRELITSSLTNLDAGFNLIRDLNRWIFTDGSTLVTKYDGAFYEFHAIEKRDS